MWQLKQYPVRLRSSPRAQAYRYIDKYRKEFTRVGTYEQNSLLVPILDVLNIRSMKKRSAVLFFILQL